jgi:hypothetical protein
MVPPHHLEQAQRAGHVGLHVESHVGIGGSGHRGADGMDDDVNPVLGEHALQIRTVGEIPAVCQDPGGMLRTLRYRPLGCENDETVPILSQEPI